MFDSCRAHADFKNPEHLACTEVSYLIKTHYLILKYVVVCYFLMLQLLSMYIGTIYTQKLYKNIKYVM